MSRRFALLISNSQYNDTKLSRLVAPGGDANALAEVLKNAQIGGFDEVATLFNKPFGDIHDAIVSFFADKKPDDLVLLYFSGHGLLDESRKLFLATLESAPARPRARSIAASFIADEMSSCRSRRQVLVLDCCHGGAFSRGVKAALNQPVGTEHIFQGEGEGRVVMTASDATQYAFEGEQVQGQGVRSVFTNYLVEGLSSGAADTDGDGKISIHDWYQYAYKQVKATMPHQTPMMWSYGQQGELILARNPHAVTSTQRITRAMGATLGADINVQPPTLRPVRTLVVDQLTRGDYETISEAIQNAQPGDRILVREGIYDEALVIDKPLEIIGEGEPSQVQVHAYNNHVIWFKAAASVVRNLTLRQLGGENSYAVYITHGRLRLEDCDISSYSLACVAICNRGTAPILRNNKIHDGKEGGIMLWDNGQGLIEGNEIWGNAYVGITIRLGAAPTVRNNKIHDGKGDGILIRDNGQGRIETNEIWGNALAGIVIQTGAVQMVRGNHISRNADHAIEVYEKGAGTFENNDLRGNGRGAWYISEDSQPLVKKKDNLED